MHTAGYTYQKYTSQKLESVTNQPTARPRDSFKNASKNLKLQTLRFSLFFGLEKGRWDVDEKIFAMETNYNCVLVNL